MPTATRCSAANAAGSSAGSSTGSSALASAAITTSEQLVKTLRVPQPPPNGVSKIDIAVEAWRTDSFFVPKKADLLSQWVLEYLCSSLKASPSAAAPGTPNKGKNKAKQQSQQQSSTTAGAVVLDLKAWKLLAAIVTAQTSNQADLSEAAKRSWLSHLANTQPVLALAGAFARRLGQDQNSSQSQLEELLSSASVSLEKLLPPATSRTAATNIEAATDSIQAWLNFFTQPRGVNEQQTGLNILQSIVKPWSTALQYGSNAKRNHQHFCSHAIPSLLQSLHTLCTPNIEGDTEAKQNSALVDVVEQIAAESLFNDDVQRSLLQAGRQKQVTARPTWKEAKVATTGVVSQLCGFLEDDSLSIATLSSLPSLSHLLYAKLHRSEALNSIVSFSSTTSGTVREAQLSLVRKTMLSEWLFPLLPQMTTSSDVPALRTQRAAARRGLLRNIESNSLYILGCEEHGEWRSYFNALFESICRELRQVSNNRASAAQVELADHFHCLTSLWQLEKSVVEPELASIFAMIAAQRVSKEALWLPEELPNPTLAALDLFRAVAAIDARFRTIPNLINTILGSLPLAAEFSARTPVESLSSSLFTSQTFLAELGKLCRDNVTPMQVSDLVHRLTGLSQGLTDVLRNSTMAKASKKQRVSHSSPSKADGAKPQGAAALTAQLQITAQVLQSINLAPTLRARSIAAAEDLHNTLILPCIDACLSSPSAARASPAICGVAAAALRVRQALLSEKWRYDPSEAVKLDGSLPTESLSCLEEALEERADTLLELLSLEDGKAQIWQLQFQIVQSLLQRAERDAFLGLKGSRYCRLISEDNGPLRDLLNGVLSANLSEAGAWNGCPDHIQSQDELMQVLWMAIVTRWAPLFDAIANGQILQALARTLVQTAQPSLQRDDAQSGMRYITSTALRNASFLELPNWRRQIVEIVQQQVSSQADLQRRLDSTAALWRTPTEWVHKSARGPLVKALLALDRDIVTAHAGNRHLTASWTQLRNLIARVVQDYATETSVSDEDLFAAMQSFLSPHNSPAIEEQLSWDRATLAAFAATVRVLLARSTHKSGISQRLPDVAKQLRQDAAVEASTNKVHITLKMRAAQEMISTLSSLMADQVMAREQGDVGSANIRAIIDQRYAKLDTLGDTAQALDVALYHLREIRLLGEAGAEEVDTPALSGRMVESLCIIFGRANALLDAEAGGRQKTLRSAADVTLELLRCIDLHGRGSPGFHTALAICRTYAALIASLSGLQQQRRLTDGLQRVVSRFDAEQYDNVLSALLAILRGMASLADDAGVDNDQAALTSTIGLVLGSAPEGTSKLARTHLSAWLAVLNTTSAGTLKLRSTVAAVSALDVLCANHAMLLRTQDMGALMQLFATLTGPSMADEPPRALVALGRSELEIIRGAIFGGVVSTLGTLVRLRQDLVVGFLPQLSLLLARLVTLFRQLRSQGGRTEASGSQRRTLRRDLPTWLDPVFTPPLGVGEARALARLLSGLTVKSVPLGGASKAESLAKPFGKHATGVLVAYLRCLTVQGATVDAEVRAELEIGMMTVCEVMGVRQRDAAMVGLLDSAGKVLMKRVWGVFEKQRYKGQ